MSKLKVAVLDAMANGEWMVPNDIVAQAHYPAPSVRSVLNKLCIDGVIERERDASRQNGMRYRLTGIPCGFGVSGNIARFDQCIRSVRA
ncbi:MarR family transcriptional regulator [Pantoea sp. FN060301]|uniref:MarR family transcriptional regulator n=1 Tax=Pantoea sp. FN060301 TaxID=3420380 RepID=UPI003D1858D4